MFDLVKPDGIGGTTIDVILGDMRPKRRRNFKLSFLLKRLTRRFDIPKEKWEKKFGPHVGGLVFTMFSDLKDRRFTVSEVMWISNIPHVGGKAGENFQGVSSKEFTAAFRSKEYSKWRGLFPTITSWESFLTNAYRIRIILRWLGWKVRSDAKTTVRFHVAVTGSLSVSREEWFNKHPEAKEVSISKADYLVTNAPSSSAKFKEAEAKGVEVVSEDKFEALYGRDKK
jgi:NAD-dependent DNA ligase